MFRAVRASSLGAEARLGRARSPVRAMHRGEEKETMRGLNERLAGYLSQVRLLEEANGKLEEQIQEVLKERRATGERDWSGYEKTIFSIRSQVKEMTLDNARLMLQIDNSRLAADDFKVKFEAEIVVRQGVEQDIVSLRKMIDETHMSCMQLESEVESLSEELLYLNKSHQQDLATVKTQIRDSSVDVQMDAAKGQDLGETIDKIRQQYEKAAQKSREETEAWYRNKFESISAEVSRNTDALQQGQNELNDLRRQRQGLEIDLQTMRSMNRSLEESLNDTAGRSSQTVNSHNMVIQQLEAELAEVHAQVSRQGAEYQALLNIKSKLEEEIATYHSLLEGTGLPYNAVPIPESYDSKGTRARDHVKVKKVCPPPDVNLSDNGAFENANPGASGSGGNDESVDFALEQALCAAPRNLTLDPTHNNETAEEEMITQKDLELNAANNAKNNQCVHKEAGQEMEEDPVILDEMEMKDDYDEMVSSVEEPVVETNEEEEETASSVVDTSVENTWVERVEEASSPVENTQEEKVQEATCPVENTQEEKVTEAGGPVENTQDKQVEEAVGPVETTVVKEVEEVARPLENPQQERVEDTQVETVEDAVSLVENIQVEKLAEAPGSVEVTQVERVEEAQCPVENTQVEPLKKDPSPAKDTQVEKEEEAAGPLEEIQTKEEEVELNPTVENDNPEEQEMEVKPAVENNNPEEQMMEVKPAVENNNPEEQEMKIKHAVENNNPEEQEMKIKHAVENNNPEEQEMKFKHAVENNNPKEETEVKQKGDEAENPEMEPLLNVKD